MKAIILFFVLAIMPVMASSQLADGWEDPRDFLLRVEKLDAPNAHDIIDTLQVPEHWRDYNRFMVLMGHASVIDNPQATEIIKRAVDAYKHPVLVYWYCMSDMRKSTYKKYADFLWENYPEGAQDLKEIFETEEIVGF